MGSNPRTTCWWKFFIGVCLKRPKINEKEAGDCPFLTMKQVTSGRLEQCDRIWRNLDTLAKFDQSLVNFIVFKYGPISDFFVFIFVFSSLGFEPGKRRRNQRNNFIVYLVPISQNFEPTWAMFYTNFHSCKRQYIEQIIWSHWTWSNRSVMFVT